MWLFSLLVLAPLMAFGFASLICRKHYAITGIGFVVVGVVELIAALLVLVGVGFFTAIAVLLTAIGAFMGVSMNIVLMHHRIPFRLVAKYTKLTMGMQMVPACAVVCALFSSSTDPSWLSILILWLIGLGSIFSVIEKQDAVKKIKSIASCCKYTNIELVRNAIHDSEFDLTSDEKKESTDEEDDETTQEETEFIRYVLDAFVEQGGLIQVRLCDADWYMKPEFYEMAVATVQAEASRKVRYPMGEMQERVADLLFDNNTDLAESFILLGDCDVIALPFGDGSYYVGGVNRDKVVICESCGMAELAENVTEQQPWNDVPGEWYCSELCRETERECDKIRDDIHAKKLADAGIKAATYGAVLPGLMAKYSYEAGRSGASLNPKAFGVAAEDGNTLSDLLHGRNARVVGSDNALNGADRIVDGVQIQTKYYNDIHYKDSNGNILTDAAGNPQVKVPGWRRSVDSSFANHGTGNYRYWYTDKDGNIVPMQLEVPKDQYQMALTRMREKILEGKVTFTDENGKTVTITDPDQAENIVRQGSLTAQQAKDQCRFFTMQSLKYDACNGLIVGVAAGGISFALTTALTYYRTRDLKGAIKASAFVGLQTGGQAFAVYVTTQQLQKIPAVARFLKDAININFMGKGKAMEDLGRGLSRMGGYKTLTEGGLQKYGQNAANKALRGAVVTAAVTFAITSAIEIFKRCNGRISEMQCYKNIAVGGAGIAGGTAGAIYGGAIGTSICPGLGTVIGGFIGGVAGGAVSGAGAKAIADKFVDDDSVEIMKIVSEQISVICFRFCLNDEEMSEGMRNVDAMISSKSNFVEDVYLKGNMRRQYVNRLVKPIFVRVAMKRPLLLADQLSPDAIGDALSDEEESAA